MHCFTGVYVVSRMELFLFFIKLVNSSNSEFHIMVYWYLHVKNCSHYIVHLGAGGGEIPVFLTCPDVDPTHSPKIGYSLCSQ